MTIEETLAAFAARLSWLPAWLVSLVLFGLALAAALAIHRIAYAIMTRIVASWDLFWRSLVSRTFGPARFTVITLAVINALVSKKVSLAELLLTNVIILGLVYAMEHLWLTRHEAVRILLYEKIELIKPENKEKLGGMDVSGIEKLIKEGREAVEKQDDAKVQTTLEALEKEAHAMAAKLYENVPGGAPGGAPGAAPGGDSAPSDDTTKKKKGDVIDAEFEESN